MMNILQPDIFPPSDLTSEASRLSTRVQEEPRCQASIASLLSSCRICLSSLKIPAVLACGHRFCEKCLQLYWSKRKKPDHIICPLCRAWVSDIDFEKLQNTEATSTEDFRKMFTPIDEDPDHTSDNILVLCLKISIVVTTFYYILKLFREPLECMVAFLQMRFKGDSLIS